ncbi:MAG: hypothetical protein A3G34_09345 [Candidatus Lindowbacteria bacterium RIFCSPLOWO2_12_FULL_62_27]|nr:MAG: hypothetical protein A3I06_08010 [Candidatus Lindowbacteria bacterium RIFCSPLOWO2_02_FULL_62_12]OGH60242.1 MAG: hypothetical protein A3G34_09345 [Candidatus Lindowbacteria bacterium RIFCSPLOWO2_12_FULL_62_27]
MSEHGRQGLIRHLKALGLTERESEDAINAILDGICEGLEQDGKVMMSGFGRFIVRAHAARNVQFPGRPRARIPARRTVRFKASTKLFDKYLKK